MRDLRLCFVSVYVFELRLLLGCYENYIFSNCLCSCHVFAMSQLLRAGCNMKTTLMFLCFCYKCEKIDKMKTTRSRNCYSNIIMRRYILILVLFLCFCIYDSVVSVF